MSGGIIGECWTTSSNCSSDESLRTYDHRPTVSTSTLAALQSAWCCFISTENWPSQAASDRPSYLQGVETHEHQHARRGDVWRDAVSKALDVYKLSVNCNHEVELLVWGHESTCEDGRTAFMQTYSKSVLLKGLSCDVDSLGVNVSPRT
jgi:hypothetical protein